MISTSRSMGRGYLLALLTINTVAASPSWSPNHGQPWNWGYGTTGSGSGGTSSPGSPGTQGGSSFNAFNTFSFEIPPLVPIHGILATVAFAFVFPLGSILMRIVPGRLALWAHALTQLLGYALFLSAAAIGFYLVSMFRSPFNEGTLLTNPATGYHLIIGIVILITLFIQPILGLVHHHYFKRLQRRQFWSHLHLWNGRLSITLGIINGGLGIQIANPPSSFKIAYMVVAVVMWSLWLFAAVMGEIRRLKPRTSEEPARGQRASRRKSRSTNTSSSGHGSSPRPRS